MVADGEDLETLKAHRSVFYNIQALAGNIDSFITDIDISSKQNYTQLSAHIQKHERKIKQVKNIDSKILRLRSPNEKERELYNNFIREDESIEFVLKLKVLLKDMEFPQNSVTLFELVLILRCDNFSLVLFLFCKCLNSGFEILYLILLDLI